MGGMRSIIPIVQVQDVNLGRATLQVEQGTCITPVLFFLDAQGGGGEAGISPRQANMAC